MADVSGATRLTRWGSLRRFSAALKRLKEGAWVLQTGRDWRLSPTALARLGTGEGRLASELPPPLARLAVLLEGGPLTAAQVAEALRVPRRTANDLLARAVQAGVAVRGEGPAPAYRLARHAGGGAASPSNA